MRDHWIDINNKLNYEDEIETIELTKKLFYKSFQSLKKLGTLNWNN